MYKDKRLKNVVKKGENIFRNFTDQHYFVVGDKISFQIGDYEKADTKYRIQGFVLAHGYSVKGNPMYLIGQINMVYYDSETDIYTSDKRTSPRWFTAKELHALDEDDPFFPKVIGYKCCETITRIIDGAPVHVINVSKTKRNTKKTKYVIIPEFNVSISKLNYSVFKKYNDLSKKEETFSGVTGYVMDNQIAAKTQFESGDKDVFRIQIIKSKWSEKKSKYIKKKPEYVYYCLTDLTKK